MVKKIILFSFTLVGVLGILNTAVAVPPNADGFFPRDREFITLTPDNPERSERGRVLALDRTDTSKDYEDIEKRLQKLLEELKRLEKDMEKRLRKEVLPHLRREIEKLRKWLRQFRMKDDDREPIKT
ncbi:MAG: hypothetical protein V1758_02195 [Pseudomonadota bacterium]